MTIHWLFVQLQTHAGTIEFGKTLGTFYQIQGLIYIDTHDGEGLNKLFRLYHNFPDFSHELKRLLKRQTSWSCWPQSLKTFRANPERHTQIFRGVKYVQ